MTQLQLCELIQRELAGGDVPIGFSPKIEEISLWLQPAIAAAAMKNYTDTAQIDIENVADAFYLTYKNLPLTRQSDTGDYVATAPAAPYALPFGFDITGGYVEGNGVLAKMVRVNQRQIDVYKRLPKPPNETFYWMEGAKVYVTSFAILDGKSIRLRMASSAPVTGMNDQINCPSDLIPYVIEFVEKRFRQPMPEDLSNDGNNKR